MRVVVSGWRNMQDARLMYQILSRYKITRLAEGGAAGADRLAAMYANSKNIQHIQYKAAWHTYGKSAGPRRNIQMLVKEKPDLLIAFLHPESKGTAHIIQEAQIRNIRTEIVRIATGKAEIALKAPAKVAI